MRHFSDYLKESFGRAHYRVPIDLPFSCPHRQRDGGAGCIFCADDGARARHLQSHLDIPKQIRLGIDYVRRRYGEESGFIAYIQSFTGTNAPICEIRRYYEEIMAHGEFPMLIVATRPDCLPEPVMDYFSELNQRLELWVELGVQTVHEKTLKLINRQHDFSCVADAAERLEKRGIKAAAHVILGLPGEGICEFRKTAESLSVLPFSAVKVHQLMILRKTPLASLYAADPDFVHPMNEYEYAAALVDFIPRLPSDWLIMRLCADADPAQIIAPKWWMSKGQFLDYLESRLQNPQSGSALPKIKTDDGSFTLYHPGYRQHFHSTAGAAAETEHKFIGPAKLAERLAAGNHIRLLDIGFGLGYNAIGAIECAKQNNGKIDIISLESDGECLTYAHEIHRDNPSHQEIIAELQKQGNYEEKNACLQFISGDARKSIELISKPIDIVFLDPFSHDRNPELWSFDFMRRIAAKLTPEGIIITYSSANPVRGAMMRCRLTVGTTPPFGRRRGGTIASPNADMIESPVSEKEKMVIRHSTAGLAYRDPSLEWTRKRICEFRRRTSARLRRMGVPRWWKDSD